jgi:hypothetical protein
MKLNLPPSGYTTFSTPQAQPVFNGNKPTKQTFSGLGYNSKDIVFAADQKTVPLKNPAPTGKAKTGKPGLDFFA